MHKLRITSIATLLLAGLAAATPQAHADEPHPPPLLAGVNTVTGTGSVAIDVALPEGAAIAVRIDIPRAPGWADLTTTGTYAAISLVSKTATFNGGGNTVNATQLHLVAPDACSGDPPGGTRYCLNPYDPTYMQLATPPTYRDGMLFYDYPPGEYTLYLLTDPGKTATATFRVSGASGSLALTPTRPVVAAFDRARDANPAHAAIKGEFLHEMKRPGFASMGIYHVGADPQRPHGPFNYQYCLTRGTPGPLSPNDCVAAAIAGDRELAGQTVMRQPSGGANMFGAHTTENSGWGGLQTATLQPGSFTYRYQVVRGGLGPAVGAWVLWLEL